MNAKAAASTSAVHNAQSPRDSVIPASRIAITAAMIRIDTQLAFP